MTLNEPARDLIHPDYDFDDADLVLLSSDGVQFRVHSTIMRLVSTVFKDMLVIKRVDGDGHVALEESKDTLSTLLDMVYPTQRPASTMSVSHFCLVAIAAEKYDMKSVTRTLKDFILGRNPTTTLFSELDQAGKYIAIEEYLVTSDLGWTAVANELSAKTLLGPCNLNSATAQGLLFSGDRAAAARDLFSLHRKRRILMYNALSRLVVNDSGLMGSSEEQSAYSSVLNTMLPSPTRLAFIHRGHCPARNTQNMWTESHLWWKFKAKVFSMLETDVSGTQFLTDDFICSSEVTALLTTPCCKCKLPTNEGVFTDHFQLIVEQIPTTTRKFRRNVSRERRRSSFM